jgi:Fungal protein kinase
LIRFVTSVAYASEVDLGWDPTIHRSVSANSSVRYKITVHQREAGGKLVEMSYLTTRLLYDSGAEALRGRGTRVFEAYRLEGDDEVGAPVAIKDVWLDDDRPREGATLTRLLEEASEDDKPLVKKYFLTVLSDGDVRIGNKVDNTRDLIMRQQDIPSGERFWLPDKSYEPRSGNVSDIGLTASWEEFRHTRAPPMTNRPFSPKTHYRIVFEEVCSPLHAVTTLQVAFQALCDGAAGANNLSQFTWHYC